MVYNIVNFNYPIALVACLGIGVLIHDIKLDLVASTAFAKITSTQLVASNNGIIKFGDFHIHSERQTIQHLKSQVLLSLPRLYQEKKYFTAKKTSLAAEGYDYSILV